MNVRHSMLGARLVTGVILAGSIMLGTGPAAAAGADTTSDTGLTARLSTTRIELSDVARFHCHDRDYPIIQCFVSTAELMADENQTRIASAVTPDLVSAYVRWYRDPGFTGPSFDAFLSTPDLRTIGWDNMISSFTPLNGGHPTWWAGPNKTGTKWDWGTASVSALGSANDQISSAYRP